MRVTKDPETRREEILKAALGLFREEGFEKVSVESIAKAAGIAKGSFYNYFKTKEDVFEAVIADIAKQTLSTARELLSDKNVSSKERLTKYINWTFHLSAEQEKSLKRTLMPEAGHSQKQMYLRALDLGIEQMFPLFYQLIMEGMAGGEFNLLDIHFTTVTMLGAFRGIHVSFHKNPEIDMKTGKVYLYDFLSRLLGTKF